jgi:uncharacterized damage-inducible protein DinB
MAALQDAEAASPMEISVASGSYRMTRLALLIHMLVHEVRHFAQISYAVRLAGLEPPGKHDFFYFRELT